MLGYDDLLDIHRKNFVVRIRIRARPHGLAKCITVEVVNVLMFVGVFEQVSIAQFAFQQVALGFFLWVNVLPHHHSAKISSFSSLNRNYFICRIPFGFPVLPTVPRSREGPPVAFFPLPGDLWRNTSQWSLFSNTPRVNYASLAARRRQRVAKIVVEQQHRRARGIADQGAVLLFAFSKLLLGQLLLGNIENDPLPAVARPVWSLIKQPRSRTQ